MMVIVYGEGFGNAPIERGCIEKAVVIKDATYAEYEAKFERDFLTIYKTSEKKKLLAEFRLITIIGYEIREDKEEA